MKTASQHFTAIANVWGMPDGASSHRDKGSCDPLRLFSKQLDSPLSSPRIISQPIHPMQTNHPMKRFDLLASIAATAVLLSAPASGALSVSIETNRFEIAFEDESVSAANQSRIETMLAAVLPAWTNAPVEFDSNGSGGTIRFWELGHPPFQHRVGIPDDFSPGETNGTFVLRVPPSFSDACALSFDWCDRHPTEVASGLDFARNLATNGIPATGIERLFFSPGVSTEDLVVASNSLRSVVSGLVFSTPMELSFAELNEDPDIPEGTPFMLLPFREAAETNVPGSPPFRNDAMPALLIDGQWRIYLWKP